MKKKLLQVIEHFQAIADFYIELGMPSKAEYYNNEATRMLNLLNNKDE